MLALVPGRAAVCVNRLLSQTRRLLGAEFGAFGRLEWRPGAGDHAVIRLVLAKDDKGTLGVAVLGVDREQHGVGARQRSRAEVAERVRLGDAKWIQFDGQLQRLGREGRGKREAEGQV